MICHHTFLADCGAVRFSVGVLRLGVSLGVAGAVPGVLLRLLVELVVINLRAAVLCTRGMGGFSFLCL